MTELESKINEWCDFISNDIAERKFYDKGEVAAYAKVKLVVAIQECLQLQYNALDAERLELVKRYTNNKNATERFRLGGQIAEINKKLKERNMTLNDIKFDVNKEVITKKEKAILCTNGGAWISCRIKDIGEPRGKHRNFSANSVYNKKTVDLNESNYLTFTLKEEKFGLIDRFKINDIVAVRYQVISKLINAEKNVYAHNLICSEIINYDEADK